MSSYRPRRTRIYDANYGIGESYYKKQLDELDNKYNTNFSTASKLGRSSATRDFTPLSDDRFGPKVSFFNDNDSDDLGFSSKFKSMKNRAMMDFEDDSSDILGSHFKREASTSRASKLSDRFSNDFLKETNDFGLKSERSAFVDDLEDQLQSTTRRLKMRSESILADSGVSGIEASSRARATKARLAELESEMQDLTDKQSEREKRSSHLKKLLNESDSMMSSEMSSFSSASASSKKVEF